MLSLNDLTLRIGSKLLFEHASFTLYRGEKIGIVGPNGAGKTSLFRLLLGELEADQGSLEVAGALRYATVKQETPGVDMSAIDYVLDGDPVLRQLQADELKAIDAGDADAIAKIHEELAHIDGYTASARAAQLMAGLGFASDELNRPVKSFSGGWRMRLNLAQALICRADVLLLDEPTNHLDLDAILWLEKFLKDFDACVLIISHDRDFLDATIRRVIHFDGVELNCYAGDFSQFERMRSERMSQAQSAFVRQERTRAHLESFITRFKAKASKAKQAQSRVKALEKLKLTEPPKDQSGYEFNFPSDENAPSPLLKVDEAELGYPDKIVLGQVSLRIQPGARIGLLGRNGAGKSTLIKTLALRLQPRSGEVLPAKGLKVAYFAQHQLDELDLTDTPMSLMRRMYPATSEQAARNFLGGYGFGNEHVHARIGNFSGGERARLSLALLAYTQPNLLLLDEPTNHLDMRTRQALAIALQDFTGAIVVVSHDRTLLLSVTDEFYLVRHGRVEPFDGDLNDYAELISRDSKTQNSQAANGSKANRRDDRRERAEARAKLKPLQNDVQRSEKALADLELKRKPVSLALADPGIYEPAREKDLKLLLERDRMLKSAITAAESAWLEASTQLDALNISDLTAT